MECSQCEERFTSRKIMAKHKQSHHSNKCHLCAECDNTFVFRSSLGSQLFALYRCWKNPLTTIKNNHFSKNYHFGGYFLICSAMVHCKNLSFFLRCMQCVLALHLSYQTHPSDDFHFLAYNVCRNYSYRFYNLNVSVSFITCLLGCSISDSYMEIGLV